MTKKHKDIRKLIAITNASDLGRELMGVLFKGLTSDDKLNQILKEEMMSEIDFGELQDMLIPVYDKNFTHADIKYMISFYDTPRGKRIVSILPSITQETIATGQAWGEKIAERLEDKIPSIIQRLTERQIEIDAEEDNLIYPINYLNNSRRILDLSDSNSNSDGIVAIGGEADPKDEHMDEIGKILRARHQFVLDYIELKGWGPAKTLSPHQIMEIRSQEGWKNP